MIAAFKACTTVFQANSNRCKLFYRFLLLIILSLPFPASSQSTLSASDITDLILVTGQSNVSGYFTDVGYDSVLDAPNLRVFAHTETDNWEVADLHQVWDVDRWGPGNGSIADPSRSPNNNFVFHFAKSVVKKDPSRVVGIIMASAAGRPISHWDTNSSFSNILEDKVISALNSQGVKSKIDGILWHQGESDWFVHGTKDTTVSEVARNHPNYYPNKLNAVIDNFRNKPWFDSYKPFICGETKGAPVNARLNALNSDFDPWTACVAATDLSIRDVLHFDAPGLRTLGQRYAEKYLEMQNKPVTPLKVALVSPLKTVTTSSPVFEWQADSTAKIYGLQIYDRNLDQWIYSQNLQSSSVCTNTVCRVQPNIEIAQGQNHLWRVRARNSSGWGPLTANQSFDHVPGLSTIPAQVTLSSPNGATNTPIPDLVWQHLPNATVYGVQMYDGSTNNWVLSNNFQSNTICAKNVCRVSPKIQLGDATNHAWRVRAGNVSGWGPLTPNQVFHSKFSVPQLATLVSPKGVTQTSTPNLTWKTDPIASVYGVQLYDGSIDQWVLSQNYLASDICDSNVCRVVPNIKIGDARNHVWRIRGGNALGWGPLTKNEVFTYAR